MGVHVIILGPLLARFGSHTMRRRVCGLVLAVLLGAPALGLPDGGKESGWPDTDTGRLAVLALIQTLNADLLASRSATLVLEKWCGDYALAASARIVAEPMKAEGKMADAEQLRRLRVAAASELKYRRVRLKCGERVLSEADNWYVYGRLTAGMSRLLETTDTPFGKAVASLEPYRQTFSARLLWSPLPEQWALKEHFGSPARPSGRLTIPAELFEHRAVLYTRDHVPFSEVREVYQSGILPFAPRPP